MAKIRSKSKAVDKKAPTKTTSSSSSSSYSTIMVRYIGMAQRATRIGERTGTRYGFTKDERMVPKATAVVKEDAPFLLAETGRGCFRRAPEALFILDEEFDETYCI